MACAQKKPKVITNRAASRPGKAVANIPPNPAAINTVAVVSTAYPPQRALAPPATAEPSIPAV